MYWWSLIYIVPMFIVLLILVIGAIVLSNENKNTRNKQKAINSSVTEKLKTLEFKKSKTFFLKDSATYEEEDKSCVKQIYVDQDKRQICFVDYQKSNMYMIPFEDILNYEVYDNGSDISGGFGGAAGGLFGAVGYGVASRSRMCKELRLIIRINRYDISQITYDIVMHSYFNAGINKTSETYKECMLSLQELVSFLEVLKAENARKSN